MKPYTLADWDRVAKEYRDNFDKLLKAYETGDRRIEGYWKEERRLNKLQARMYETIRPALDVRMEKRTYLIKKILSLDTKITLRPYRKFPKNKRTKTPQL